MGYPVREYIPGFWYHVVSKGQRDEPLFFSPEDRIQYLSYLDEELDRCGGSIGSFCMMTNHSHLLLRMGETPLGNILRTAHSQYARDFNRRRGISGHLTQKRPNVRIILDDCYLRTVVGYIHCNPVAANIVNRVRDYDWSSWVWFLEPGKHWIQLESWSHPPGFKNSESSHRFLEVIQDKPKEIPGGKKYIGNHQEWDQFRERRQTGRDAQRYSERRGRRSKLEILREISDKEEFSIQKLRGPGRERDVSGARQRAMAEMYQDGHPVNDIARFFNRTPGAVSQAHQKWTSEEADE